jgi:hypothetical protein
VQKPGREGAMGLQDKRSLRECFIADVNARELVAMARWVIVAHIGANAFL